MATEPRNVGEADLDEVAEHAEQATDDHDRGLAEAGQRGGGVLAGGDVPLVGGEAAAAAPPAKATWGPMKGPNAM